MPGSARKFHSRQKFGKKRKKSLINNLKRPPAPAVCAENDGSYAPNDRVDDSTEVEVGLTRSSARETATASGRIRHDTVMLRPSDVQRDVIRTKKKLGELASTPATKRKSDCFRDDSSAADRPLDEACFTIVSLASLNDLLRLAKCSTCGGDISVEKGEREYGLAVKLVLKCVNCGDTSSSWSSPRACADRKVNPFVVNVLAARAMQSTGNQQTALNDIFSTMNISHRGLHTKTWQDYIKKKLTPAATRAAQEMTADCARSVRELYSELRFGNPGNIAVSYDGTWMTRGHTSHIGVGTVIELFTGLVLDYVVLCNFCAGCERGPKPDEPSYQAWRADHLCQKNTEKKAGEMEVEAALILFERSLKKNGLRYTTMLSDGDSRAFLALQEADVYGYVKVEKEDCINHVKKRMGTALRNLIAKQKGTENLGGKGKLTGSMITKLSSYYAWALKSHKGDVDSMHKAVMATYRHITSNDETSDHSLCPSGPNSWCQHNAAASRGEPAPKHRHNLPPHVCKALLPIYERLSERKLLERCHRGKTQNSNESLHSLIWALAPKERHASLYTVQAAVAEAVMRFNAGSERTSKIILRELGLNTSAKASKRMTEKDERREHKSARKHAAAENVQSAFKKRHLDNGKQRDYIPGGF
ncbi:uncharacterized protein LOC144101435 [Amblyomma americanum]